MDAKNEKQRAGKNAPQFADGEQAKGTFSRDFVKDLKANYSQMLNKICPESDDFVDAQRLVKMFPKKKTSKLPDLMALKMKKSKDNDARRTIKNFIMCAAYILLDDAGVQALKSDLESFIPGPKNEKGEDTPGHFALNTCALTTKTKKNFVGYLGTDRFKSNIVFLGYILETGSVPKDLSSFCGSRTPSLVEKLDMDEEEVEAEELESEDSGSESEEEEEKIEYTPKPKGIFAKAFGGLKDEKPEASRKVAVASDSSTRIDAEATPEEYRSTPEAEASAAAGLYKNMRTDAGFPISAGTPHYGHLDRIPYVNYWIHRIRTSNDASKDTYAKSFLKSDKKYPLSKNADKHYAVKWLNENNWPKIGRAHV